MERDQDGAFATDHDASPDDIWRSMAPDEVYTTGELAEKFDAPRRTVYQYLRQLEDDGRVASKKPNDRLKLWWRDV